MRASNAYNRFAETNQRQQQNYQKIAVKNTNLL